MPRRPRIAFVGAGPRSIGILARLASNLRAQGAVAQAEGQAALDIHLFDPHAPGPGRIWREDQSPLLRMNSLAADVTMFTDASVDMLGPVEPGPMLYEWAKAVRENQLPEVTLADADLLAEINALEPTSFATRRLHSAYLTWFYRTVVDQLQPYANVITHRGSVESIRHGLNGTEQITYRESAAPSEPSAAHSSSAPPAPQMPLAEGASVLQELRVDAVVLALGHFDAETHGRTARLEQFAHEHPESHYFPPSYTADTDLSAIEPGQDVLVSGMGLAFIDLMILLSEGRQGRFVREKSGALTYLRSGQEPHLLVGSRRGVPYHSKTLTVLLGEAYQPRFVTEAAIKALVSAHGELDYQQHLWPQLARELLSGYYRELATGHPERFRGEWAQLLALLGEDELPARAAILPFLTDERDYLDLQLLQEPLRALADSEVAVVSGRSDTSGYSETAERPGAAETSERPEAVSDASGTRAAPRTQDELQSWMRSYIQEDLRVRTTRENTQNYGLFLALLNCHAVLARIPREWLSAKTIEVLGSTWYQFFSFVASGPPPERLEQLLALQDAGALTFLGADLQVTPEVGEHRGYFSARSSALAEPVRAPVLIDAYLPEQNVTHTASGLLRSLYSTSLSSELAAKRGRQESVTQSAIPAGDRVESRVTKVRVDAQRRLLTGPEGGPQRPIFAVGAFTDSPVTGAFQRPGTNSLALRENDAVARLLLEEYVFRTAEVEVGGTSVGGTYASPEARALAG